MSDHGMPSASGNGEYEDRYEHHRRQFMKGMLASTSMGLAGLAGCTGDGDGGGDTPTGEPERVEGESPAERAISAAADLADDAPKNTIKVQVPAGTEGNLNIVADQWKEKTGLNVEVVPISIPDIYQKVVSMGATQSSDFDVFMTRPLFMPDYVESDVAQKLNNFSRKYGPGVTKPDETAVIPPLHLYGNMYKGDVWQMVTDGDVMHLHLRTAWLENEDYQQQYEDEYGEPLEVPETYDELDRQIKFFGSMEGKHGAWIFMSPFWSRIVFMRRLLARGVLPFDDEMRPQFNGPEGVAVLEQLKALKPYNHSNAPDSSWTSLYSDYGRGNTYAAWAWPSLELFLRNPDNSEITNEGVDWRIHRGVGREVNGELLRPVNHQTGWSYLVNKHGEMPELSYLYSQWMDSPSVTNESLDAEGGLLDPFRRNHLEGKLPNAFGGDDVEHWIDVHKFNINHSFPELTLRGTNKYVSAIDDAVTNVLNNDKDPQTELDKAAETAEQVTEDIGRETQVDQWRFMQSTYSKHVRDILDLPEPPEYPKIE